MCCSAAFAADVASAKLDLSRFGYRVTGSTSVFADYSDLTFLSDDLLVVSINQRSFGPVEPSFADTPESSIIVFDVRKASVTSTGKMAVEKASGSVQAISGERFAVLNEKGLQFCDRRFHCVAIGPAKGPMLVSPQGKRVIVGGNGLSAQTLVDTETLKQIAAVDRSREGFKTITAIPGDDAILVDRVNRKVIRKPGMQDTPFNIDDEGTFPEFRFLNEKFLAGLDHSASEVAIVGMDGERFRNYKVEKAWRTGFLSTASGMRFAIYEHGYTTLNSILNFLDIDDGRPENFQRVRVIDMSSGKEIFRLEWDPRPHLIKPALSPSGHWLARVTGGVLEVFQVN